MLNFIMDKDDHHHRSNLSMLSFTPTSTCTSPPSTPTSVANVAAIAARTRLYRAKLIVENQLYDQLLERYNMAVMSLGELTSEANTLHEENKWLRLTNEDLTRRLSSLSVAGNDLNNNGRPDRSSPRSVIVHVDGEDRDQERVAFPESISVRSPTCFKLASPSSSPTASRHVNARKLRVRSEEKRGEMDVYSQGMYKTELCNKWQETGTCQYNENCQFAHGLSELRPVIRHPRYKTQVCRMVLAGATCPYGHRCHFRHSTTTTRLNSR